MDGEGFKLVPILGFEWHPWSKKENASQNFSLVLWAGPSFPFGGYEDKFVFQNTESIYPAKEKVEASLGVLISYTLFKND